MQDTGLTLLETVLLAVVQGLTEFLPVSSSGHLTLVAWVIGGEGRGIAFDVAVHAGSLAAVLIWFHRPWIALARSVISGSPAHFGGDESIASGRKFALLLAIGTIPAAVVGILLSGLFEDFSRTPQAVGWLLLGTAAVLFAAHFYQKQGRPLFRMRISDSAFIGLAQAVSILPGVSRSGVTISVGMFAGLNRTAATKFSLMLSAPIVAGATLYTALGWSSDDLLIDWQTATLGAGLSFVFSLLAIGFMVRFTHRVGLLPFAVYAATVGAAVVIAVTLGF